MTTQLTGPARSTSEDSPWARPETPTPPRGPDCWGPAPGFKAPPTATPLAPPAPPSDSGSGSPADETSAGTDDDGDRTRTGAVWVTGMGAFLLVAAAAVFVAVQWDRIHDEVKLGILAALTGGFLLAGRRLRSLLPATSGVLFHLGAFLIPANVAAAALHLHVEWPAFLLLQGLTATLAWWLLSRVERSVVLRWAAGSAAVVAAAGISAVTSTAGLGIDGVPTPLILATAAVIAHFMHARRPAIGWAVIAGIAPAFALTVAALPRSSHLMNVLTNLGLVGTTPHLTALLSGAMAAYVLGVNARRQNDVILVVLAAVSAVLGTVNAWVGLAPQASMNLIGAGALFLMVEVVVHFVRHDDFWAGPAKIFAFATEIVAATLTAFAALAACIVLVDATTIQRLTGPSVPAWSALVAGSMAAIAWFVADLRRRLTDSSGTGIALLVGAGWFPTTIMAPLALLSGVAAASLSLSVVAIVAVLLAGLLVLGGRPLGHGIAATLIFPAVIMVALDPSNTLVTRQLLTVAVVLIGSLTLAAAAVVRARMSDQFDNGPLAWITAIGALIPIQIAWICSQGSTNHLALFTAMVGASWLVAAVLDLGAETHGLRLLGYVGRFAVAFTLVEAWYLTPMHLVVLGLVITALALTDSLRLRTPWPLYTLAVTLPVVVFGASGDLGFTRDQTGLAICLLASVAAGIHLLTPRRWGTPALSVVVSSAASGILLASNDPGSASTAVIILGGIGLAYSAVHRSLEGGIFAWIMVSAGIWGHLTNSHISDLDAYVAPVAFGLVVAGLLAQRGDRQLSSWVAFAPAIILLGGTALLERINGGGGVHAVLAGTIGVAAVLAGGTKRWAAPLFLGTALLVALTIHESLGVTSEVPTWGWLALGGSVLLAAGIAMERLETGPVESGRRLVDVVHERFS